MPYQESWHVGAEVEVLEAVTAGLISRLVINVPPSTGKSTIVSVMWPAWEWTLDPSHRYVCTAYGDALVMRDAERFLRIVQSSLYRAAWPGTVVSKPRPAVSQIETTAHGRRFSAQLGGGILGFHGNRIILDDPIKPNDAEAVSGVALEKAEGLITKTLSSRLAGEEDAIVCIMQRLADQDPAEILLNQGYEHLMLPMRYVPNASWDRGCSLGKLDPRTEPGELLCPARYPIEKVLSREVGLGDPQAVSAQEQQNPVPKTGAFFEEAWFGKWASLPARPRYVQSWDLGFKGKTAGKPKTSHSRVHGALWCWTKRDFYWVDEVIGTWNYPQTKVEFQAVQDRPGWAESEAILVEDKANGPALIAELLEEYPLIVPIEPIGSKEDRASRQSSLVESGRVWVPSEGPWVAEALAELIKFPRAKHNDRVDTTTQALEYMRDSGRRLREALAGVAAAFRAG